MSVWDFGDGEAATNQPCVTHDWWKPGDYLVTLWAFNESYPGGVSGTLEVHVAGRPIHFVAATSPNPQPPYGSWARAARDIPPAVDAAAADDVILVSNGVYPGGVRVDKPVALQSVNGPLFTIIDGGGRDGCVSLTNGASLSGFTLTRGAVGTGGVGGGVRCASANASLTNCTLTGNSADGGGGAYGGTLYDCTLTNNDGGFTGGGAEGSMLYNCTLTGNWASDAGGGAYNSTLYNCTLVDNSCDITGGGASGGTLYNCTLSGNSASWGGGACGGTLYNCTLTGNLARINFVGHGGLGAGRPEARSTTAR